MIDKQDSSHDFDYSDTYAVIVMKRIEVNAEKKPTKKQYREILSELRKAEIVHEDITHENVLWDEELQRFQVIDFGCAQCGYVISGQNTFENDVLNEVYCQQVSNFYNLSPPIKGFWFVNVDRAEYVLPRKNFTEKQRYVLFELFDHFYQKKFERNDSVRFVLENQTITWVDEQGSRKHSIKLKTLQSVYEEDPKWFQEAGFEVYEDGVRKDSSEVSFLDGPRSAAAAPKRVKKPTHGELVNTLYDQLRNFTGTTEEEFEDILYEPQYDVTHWQGALVRAGMDRNKVNLMSRSEVSKELSRKFFATPKLSDEEIAAAGAESSDSDASTDSDYEVEGEEEEEDDDDYEYVEDAEEVVPRTKG